MGDSLLAYGMLLQSEGRDEEAIPRLDEYVQRYPDSRQVIDARYLIAEAYRRSAQTPRQRRRPIRSKAPAPRTTCK